MNNRSPAWFVLGICGIAARAIGATATFTPVGPTSVSPGVSVVFDISVTASGGFNTADIVIGSVAANDIAFVYSPAWVAAFSNVSPITYDNGFFAQDAFVGGNHASSVGSTLALGTVTINTTGMTIGTYSVHINNTLDGVSALGLGGTPDPIIGAAAFVVTPPPPAPANSIWGLMTLGLGVALCATFVLRGQHRAKSVTNPL